jgi:hypothetical protein
MIFPGTTRFFSVFFFPEDFGSVYS